jgi:cell division protein FtsA
MNTNRHFITVDLGSSRISVMAAEIQEDDSIRIISEESKPSEDVKWGIVEQATGAAFKVSELQKYLQNSSQIKEISKVSVSIGAKTMRNESTSISRFIGNPNVVTKQLLEDMAFECRRQSEQANTTIFEVLPISYEIDGKQIEDPLNHSGKQITINYQLILGDSLIKTKLDDCFDRTGISIELTPLAIEALSTVLLEERERKEGCALINLGATTTTLAVYFEGTLQNLLVIPLGSKNITKDIEELGISFANAERLKCLKGCALESLVLDPIFVQIPSVTADQPPVRISTQFLATIIEARLEEILQSIFDVLDQLPFPLDAGIVLSGGGSKLANLKDFIESKTTIYTRFGSHADWLSDDTSEHFFDPCFAQAIGTILLTAEYRKEHPQTDEIEKVVKAPKIPGKPKFTDKIANGFLNFFSDENKI